jgi:hypothetical protein
LLSFPIGRENCEFWFGQSRRSERGRLLPITLVAQGFGSLSLFGSRGSSECVGIATGGDRRAGRSPPRKGASPRSVNESAKARRQFIEADQSDLPDGLFCNLLVQPHLQKYFVSGLTQITFISIIVLSHRGAFRDRHRRWERDAVDAAAFCARRDGRAGRKARERSNGVLTRDVCCGR